MISYPFTAKPILDTEGDPVLDVNGFPTYDRTIDSAMERAFNKQKWTNGVWAYPTDGLQVVAKSGMTVTAKIGGAQIEGAQGYNETDLDILLSDANATLDRIDRIVVRFNLNDAVRSIEIYKKEGVAGTTPEAPSITQESNYYELVLGDVYVNAGATEITSADILDQRFNSELCGLVIPAIPTPLDTTELFDQYKTAIDGTTAGVLQVNIDAVADNLEPVQKYHTATADTNGDFYVDLDGLSDLATGDIVRVTFPSATDNTQDARLSIDGGATYKNIHMGTNVPADAIENESIAFRYDGTYFEPIQLISGENSNGYWEKHPDGVMICTKSIEVSIDINVAWGSSFVSTFAPLGNFPMSFTEVPITTATGKKSANNLLFLIAGLNAVTSSSCGQIQLYRATSTTGDTYTVDIQANGFWK